MFRRHERLKRFTDGFGANDERVSPIFKTNFHTFYYSFLVGVAAGERANDISGAKDMIDYFPENFRETKNQIIAVLIHTYTKELGIKLDDKQSLKKMVSGLINVEARQLSSEGYKRVNEYAYRGFEIIEKNIKYAVDPIDTIKKISQLINAK